MLMDHGTREAHDIAEAGTILLVLVGSTVHGLAVDDQDDRDEMGICTEPATHVIGSRRFEQYQYRTQPEGERSGPGDLDLTVYSLRKWMRLALDGNPTMMLPLFVPDDAIIGRNGLGYQLRDNADRIVSRQAGRRYLGYLQTQRDRLLGIRGGAHVNRPELVERYGFDTKYAGHMVRLGLQGVELMTTGRLTLPMADPDRQWIVDLRKGLHTYDDAIERTAELEAELVRLTNGAESPLPEYPDREWADRWLADSYQYAWGRPALERYDFPLRPSE